MSGIVEVSIYQITGTEFCVSADDGQVVYEQILKAFQNDLSVQLSFQNVKRLTSAFLNVAIGKLYGTYEEEFIKEHLHVKSDINQSDAFLLKRVVEQAKRFFHNPEIYKKAYETVMG